MAETPTFPQIPSTVWWGTRNLLKKAPSAKLDEAALSAHLGVQPAASRQYVAELRRAGILDDEGKATPAALQWRNDETYKSAVEAIARGAYPESLLSIAPPGEADRQVVVNWFLHHRLGEGAAKNKAATYLLITSPEPNAAPTKVGSAEKPRKESASRPKSPKASSRPAIPAEQSGVRGARAGHGGSSPPFPLNVNVQIHISADASLIRSMRFSLQ
jgi:hypothetical protein